MATSYSTQEPKFIEGQMSYLIYQKEKCPTTGKEHFQCFLCMKARSRLSTMKKLSGWDGSHFERMKGTVQQSIDYCSKEESRIAPAREFGTRPTAQEVGGVQSAISELKEKSVKRVLEDNPTLWRSVRSLQEVKRVMTPKRNFMTFGLFLTGKTGTGKSRIASTLCSFFNDSAWTSDSTLKWWDPYQGEEVVVCDDVVTIPVQTALRAVDRYPLEVPIKGSFSTFRAQLVVFTSNYTMNQVFCPGPQEPALRRRVIELEVY